MLESHTLAAEPRALPVRVRYRILNVLLLLSRSPWSTEAREKCFYLWRFR